MSMTLYELTGQWLSLLQMAQDEELDPLVLEDTFESLEGEIEDKADGCARVIRQLKGEALAIDAEIGRLTKMKASREANAAAIKRSLEVAMVAIDKKKFKTSLFSFGIQKNPASVKIDDADAVPEVFLIPQPPKEDKTKIKAYLNGLEDGETCAWAHLEQGESLRIR